MRRKSLPILALLFTFAALWVSLVDERNKLGSVGTMQLALSNTHQRHDASSLCIAHQRPCKLALDYCTNAPNAESKNESDA